MLMQINKIMNNKVAQKMNTKHQKSEFFLNLIKKLETFLKNMINECLSN